MAKTDKIHLLIISVINFALILKMISIAWGGNDKAILLIIFGYPILTIFNGLIWLILVLLKRKERRIYKLTTIGLAILFIPTLMISSMY